MTVPSATVDVLDRYALRWADAADGELVAELVGQLLTEIADRVGSQPFTYDPTTSAPVVRRWLSQGQYQALLALEGDVPVGVATVAQSHALYAGGTIGIVQEFVVRESARSNGLGARMLDRVVELAKRRGWVALELCTPPLPQFDRTLDFYERQDFKVVGGRKMRLMLTDR